MTTHCQRADDTLHKALDVDHLGIVHHDDGQTAIFLQHPDNMVAQIILDLDDLIDSVLTAGVELTDLVSKLHR